MDALNTDLINTKEMDYCDLMLKLLRCQGEMLIRKSRRKDISLPLSVFISVEGKCSCSDIYAATFPLLSKVKWIPPP